MAGKKGSGRKILVTQVRSSNRHPRIQLRTLQALGLGRIGHEHEHVESPALLGMLKSVSHLVTIQEIK